MEIELCSVKRWEAVHKIPSTITQSSCPCHLHSVADSFKKDNWKYTNLFHHDQHHFHHQRCRHLDQRVIHRAHHKKLGKTLDHHHADDFLPVLHIILVIFIIILCRTWSLISDIMMIIKSLVRERPTITKKGSCLPKTESCWYENARFFSVADTNVPSFSFDGNSQGGKGCNCDEADNFCSVSCVHPQIKKRQIVIFRKNIEFGQKIATFSFS